MFVVKTLVLPSLDLARFRRERRASAFHNRELVSGISALAALVAFSCTRSTELPVVSLLKSEFEIKV